MEEEDIKYCINDLLVYPSEFDSIEDFSNTPSKIALPNLNRLVDYLNKSLIKLPKQKILSGYRDYGLDAYFCGIDNPSNHIYGTCVDIEYTKQNYQKLIQVFSKLKETDIIKRYAGNGFKWLHIEIGRNGYGRHIIDT